MQHLVTTFTHPRSLRGAAGLLVASGLLAACAGSPAIENGDYAAAYRVSELVHAGRNDGVPLTVVGNPFGMSDEAATAATAERLRVPGWAPQVDFRPRTAADGGYGVVLAFNPPPATSAREVCGVQFGRSVGEPQPSGDATRVSAAFCNGGALSSTRAKVTELEGPDDQRYQDLLSQLSLTLFPAQNPHVRDDGPRKPLTND